MARRVNSAGGQKEEGGGGGSSSSKKKRARDTSANTITTSSQRRSRTQLASCYPTAHDTHTQPSTSLRRQRRQRPLWRRMPGTTTCNERPDRAVTAAPAAPPIGTLKSQPCSAGRSWRKPTVISYGTRLIGARSGGERRKLGRRRQLIGQLLLLLLLLVRIALHCTK